MKIIIILSLLLSLLCGCAKTTDESTPISMSNDPERASALVIYFNYADNVDGQGVDVDTISSASLDGNGSGNTNTLVVMADEIADRVYADTFKIIINERYPYQYDEMLEVAKKDQEQETVFTFKAQLTNLDQYNEIYLGTPVWWGTLPQPVVGFLQSYDFSNKTIIPFGIHAGSGFGSILKRYSELTEAAIEEDGLTINAYETTTEATIEDVVEWLKALKNRH